MRKSIVEKGAGKNNYLYNGIEHNDDFGLDWDMATFRSYDAAIGRWGQIDPMAENHFNFTSYNFVLNNPLIYLDPLGLDTIPANSNYSSEGQLLESFKDGMSDVVDSFFGEVKFEKKLGLGGEVELGPVKGKAEFNIYKHSATMTEEEVSSNHEWFQGEIAGELGSAKVKAKGNLMKVSLKSDANDPASTSFFNGKSEASVGDDGFSLMKDSNVNVAGTLKVGPAKIKGGVNMIKLSQGINKMFQGTGSYLQSKMNQIIKPLF